MMRNKRVNVCGIQIDNLTMQEAIREIERLIQEKKPSYVVTPNVDHVVTYQKDKEFRELYQNADLVLADGVPILWAARFLGTPLKEKVSGSDLLPLVCAYAARKHWRLLFLGAAEGVAQQAAQELSKKYDNLHIVGVYSPPFGFEKDEDETTQIINLINATKPDVLLVGLGAPKQEKWIYRYRNIHQVPVSIGIGASFDFAAGVLRRAPSWMQHIGLEWFWRFLMEPRRLWKRYFVRDPWFFLLLLGAFLKSLTLSTSVNDESC